jgi:hypothetical protein
MSDRLDPDDPIWDTFTALLRKTVEGDIDWTPKTKEAVKIIARVNGYTLTVNRETKRMTILGPDGYWITGRSEIIRDLHRAAMDESTKEQFIEELT